MRLKAAFFGAVLLPVAELASCSSTYAPALMIQPTAASRDEVFETIAQALHVDQVALADDALTTTPSLTIERTPARDERGLLLNGRELSKPETFELYAVRSACVLVHAQSNEQWVLRHVTCRAIRNPSGASR